MPLFLLRRLGAGFGAEPRACLKNHSPGLHAPLRGLLRPNLVPVAPLRLPNWVLHPTKYDAHPGESIFQTRSRSTMGTWREEVCEVFRAAVFIGRTCKKVLQNMQKSG